MKVHIEKNPVEPVVRVYIWEEHFQGGRRFTYPSAVTESGDMIWTQKDYNVEGAKIDPPPAFVFSWQLWDEFKKAMLEGMGLTQDVSTVLVETLKREQTRVDVLIHALIQAGQPVPLMISKEGTHDHTGI